MRPGIYSAFLAASFASVLTNWRECNLSSTLTLIKTDGCPCRVTRQVTPVSAGFGVAELNEAPATGGRAKVGRGCEAQRSEAIPNRTDSGLEF